jgi:hypothetical protein
MDEGEPRVIDAKFKVVSDPNRLRWWQGWRLYIDWRNAILIGGLSAAAALGPLLLR